MATATYIKGEKVTIDYTCGAAVVVDQIVTLGSTDAAAACVGVAQVAGVTGDVIAVDIAGCYIFPAVTGAVIAQGEGVNYVPASGAVDDTASTPGAGGVGDFGVALEAKAAAASATTIAVKLTPGTGVYDAA